METVKARLHVSGYEGAPIIPIRVPDLERVRAFALGLHRKRQAWQGEAFGWQAEYTPSRLEPPLESKMTFTPADFVIGESGIWFFSVMWEHGDDAPPVEFLDNRSIVGTIKDVE